MPLNARTCRRAAHARFASPFAGGFQFPHFHPLPRSVQRLAGRGVTASRISPRSARRYPNLQIVHVNEIKGGAKTSGSRPPARKSRGARRPPESGKWGGCAAPLVPPPPISLSRALRKHVHVGTTCACTFVCTSVSARECVSLHNMLISSVCTYIHTILIYIHTILNSIHAAVRHGARQVERVPRSR
jgi:hypothetical protein